MHQQYGRTPFEHQLLGRWAIRAKMDYLRRRVLRIQHRKEIAAKRRAL